MREHDWSNVAFFSGSATAAALNTPFNIMGLAGISVTIKPVSGTTNGQFKLQITDFGGDQNNLPVSADWVDYPSAVAPASTGAVSASQNIQVWALLSKWARIVFTDNSSSSPVIAVSVTGRARP